MTETSDESAQVRSQKSYSPSKVLKTPLVPQVPSNEIDSASFSAGQIRFPAVERNRMKWVQIVGIVCASILIERLSLAILVHFFRRGGSMV